MNKIDEKFALRLRNARIKAGLTQEQLGKKLGFKGNTAVYRFEAGISSPSIEILCCLAKILNIDLHWLITGNPSLAVERLRMYASAHIAEVYGKVDDLKMQLAALELRQSVGHDCGRDIEKISNEIKSSRQFAEDLRRHINEVLEPMGRAFE